MQVNYHENLKSQCTDVNAEICDRLCHPETHICWMLTEFQLRKLRARCRGSRKLLDQIVDVEVRFVRLIRPNGSPGVHGTGISHVSGEA